MQPTVRIVIPTRGKVRMLRQCLMSLFAATDLDKEIAVHVVVIEGGGTDGKTFIEKEHGGRLAKGEILWMAAEDGWSFSKLNNVAVAYTPEKAYDYLLLLNNDTVAKKGFLRQMVVAMEGHPEVGIVGAKLVFPTQLIQHCGVAFKSEGIPYHLGWGKPDDGTFAPAERSDYYDSVTFACALIRKEVWEECEGLDEAYFFNYEDVDFCLKAREAGWRTYLAHKAVLVHLEGKSLEFRKTKEHSVWRNLKILRDRWITPGKLAKLCGISVNTTSGAMRDDRMNIAFVPGGRGVGVPWWRIEQPAKKIAKQGLANVELVYADTPQPRLQKVFENAHVGVFQGYWSEWVWRLAALREGRSFGMVYDYDDHPIYISPFAQAYRTFGTEEIKLQSHDGEVSWLWRDGENGFDLERNRENRQRQIEIFHLVDMMTTTVTPLSTYFKTLNPSVQILPNCIDFDIYRHQYTLFERTPGPIRIGWHGGDNHFHDISEIGADLVKFVNTHDVKLVLFGAYYRGPLRGIDPSKVEEHEWVHVEAFPYKLASLGVDIAVIPLADPAKPMMGFNGMKSGIKWYEHSALRTPCLISAGRAPYSEAVDGETAMLFATPEEFHEKLGRLVSDASLRRRIGTNGLHWVREHRDLDKEAYRWVDAYTRIARNAPGSAPSVEDMADSIEDGPEPDRPAGSNAVSEAAEANAGAA